MTLQAVAKSPIEELEIGLGKAARLAGLSRPTLTSAFDRGDLRGYWKGRQRRTTQTAVLDYLSVRADGQTRKASTSLTNKAGLASQGLDYAFGGYSAIHASHPRYWQATQNATIWASQACFERTLARAKESEIVRTTDGSPSTIIRRAGEAFFVIAPWPKAGGRLSYAGIVGRSAHLLDREKLLATIALEQAFILEAGGEVDRETLALLLLERGVDLSAVLNILSALERSDNHVAWPIGAAAASAIERTWKDVASIAKRLIAETLWGINKTPRANAPFFGVHGEIRPLGRSPWRDLIESDKDANGVSFDANRLLSLIGSL